MAEVEDVLARLECVRHGSGGWSALCPAHEDRSPSLSIAEGTEGIILHCHAGCSYETVIAAIGLTRADLFYEPITPRANTDAGHLLRDIVRRTTPPVIPPIDRIDDIMWQALVTDKLPEETWVEAVAKAGVNHPDLMGMSFQDAMKHRSVFRDGPLFDFLEPLWNHIGQPNWHALANEAFKRMGEIHRRNMDKTRLDV